MTEERRDQAEQGEGYVGHTEVEGENPPSPEYNDGTQAQPEQEAVQEDEGVDHSTAPDTNEFPDEEPQEQRFDDGEGVVQGQSEETTEHTDPASRAQSQVQAQDQANANYELEFENRIAPLRDEIQTYRDDLASQGDEAGAAHASHFLDMIIQRFRLPGDTSSPENQEQ